ncbi:ketopantoate reductase family protein [Altericroceibacterium xinjiangense]|uniref:ketopantoate reductase family protein n=1 Tax=Altericroceibacterium xinjiangense TaxID=762261 RepID=UPI000F7DBDD8|nr:2-dehydropantoate 2-reductase [Altericroceibacterium xinjiangense]
MKVFIVGAGAMGCLYAGAFHRAGCAVTLVDVNREHLEAISANGLELETRAGTEHLPLAAVHPAEVSGTADLILLFTKTFQTDAALAGVKTIIGPETRVLTLQNGLGNDERVARHVARENVLTGVSTLPSDLVGPGRVRSHGEGGTKLYPAFSTDEGFARTVAERLTAGGLPSGLDPAIGSAIWSKAIFNAAMNPLCALTRRTPGFLGANPESRAMIRQAVAEGAATAEASGVAVDAQAILDLTEVSMSDHANHEPSMLQDLNAGRRTEVDAINGAIVEAAEQAGVATPLLQTLWQLVRLEEAKLA